jgi:hypothetical protein
MINNKIPATAYNVKRINSSLYPIFLNLNDGEETY